MSKFNKGMITLVITFALIEFLLPMKLYSQPIWTFQNSGTTQNLNRIFREYTNTGEKFFIVGDSGIILRTSNSGLIWDRVNSNTISNLYSIVINYNDTGYASGSNGTIIKTIDGGFNWHLLPPLTSNTIREIKFVYNYPFKVLAVGENGTFLKFQDNTWTAAIIDTGDFNSFNVAIFTPLRIHLIGDDGLVLKSTNNGTSWTRLTTNTNKDLNHIQEYNNNVVGDSGTRIQIQNNSIIQMNLNTPNDLYQILEGTDQIIGGSNGAIFRRQQLVNTNTTAKLLSVVQTYDDNCYAAGENGTIIFTNTLLVSPHSKQLNANNINAWYDSDGNYNSAPPLNGGFEWPKHSHKYARYSSGHLIGAIVNGDTLVSVIEYGSEYYPGYTDDNGQPQGHNTPEYRIYRLVFGENDSDRIKWPNSILGNSNQGAPVYFDSVTMNWKPSDFGNQTMFYSYTDSYPESHNYYNGRTAPLKADIKQINYSFNQPEELKNVIYQEYRIINRGINVWHDAYINLYTDDDLGVASNDAEGTDTNLRLAYTYNGLPNDEYYGINPPAVGFAIIRSPLIHTGNLNDTVYYYEGKRKRIKLRYKESRLNSNNIYHDDTWQPQNYRESYNAIRGFKNDGSPYINPITNQNTKFVYSGDPVTNQGWVQSGVEDMRFYQGFGPFNINPGDTQYIVVAQVIAQGSSNLNSITKLREASVIAKNYYDNMFEGIVIGINNNTSAIPDKFELFQNYPNPFNPATIISFSITKTSRVRLHIYDVSGREVKTLLNELKQSGKYEVEWYASDFASGAYFCTLEVDGNIAGTKRMVLLK